ncbi:MAG: endolytic transglycosylase MltG, partial [Gammaproteobacteria bacterium]
GWVSYDYRAFTRTPLALPAEGLVYELAPGRSLRALATDLEHRGVIDNARYLEWLARRKGVAARVQAGEYRIPAGTRPEAFLNLLVAGKVVQYSLTIIEGWTFQQMLAAVRAHPVLVQTLHDQTPQAIMAALGHPDEHPEGRFLPDTYHFPHGMTDRAFLARAHSALRQTLAREWSQRAEGLPLKTPEEALILASIIERETGVPEERATIAGVFVRRLQLGMRLQTDPTVIYGLGEAFDGNLRRRDLRSDTPYNTYTRFGLPPTPIALAGAAAIHAALHPADGDALYFVSKRDGSHQFSATLEEHNRAVRTYQLTR